MKDKFDISDNNRVVEALKAGDEQMFKAVYMEYSAALRTYANTILRDREAAYEVVQDVFMAVWLNRKKLDETKLLRNYLLRAVHNNSLRLLKYNTIRKLREEKAMAEQLKACEENEEPLQGAEILSVIVARLPEQSRRVLRMSYWEKKKNADIAAELSISVRTVETILYKVIKKLRGEMKKN